eukprot:jgi/Bigna1/70158/fgenesh1_pg.11_\
MLPPPSSPSFPPPHQEQQYHYERPREDPVVSPTVFLVEAEKIDPDSRFSHNETFIEHHNKNPTSTWVAKAYPRFQNRRVSEMMQLLGSSGHEVFRVRRHHPRRLGDFNEDAEDELDLGMMMAETGRSGINSRRGGKKRTNAADQLLSPSFPQRAEDSFSKRVRMMEKYLDLPESFDWRERGIVTPVRNQGACGSCYAVAAMDVATMRYMIKSGRKDVAFSMDDVLNQSFYNQGCAGGYPFLVGKHGQDLGLVTEECYRSGSGSCPRHFIDGYRYLGGYYGACNEQLMKEEIYKNGPIVAAFNAPSNLFSYHRGVFSGGHPDKDDNWEKTNHAIVVVGWGVSDQGNKYWIVKNSWGEFWGEDGYFKMKRGTDDCAFESMGVAIDFRSRI